MAKAKKEAPPPPKKPPDEPPVEEGLPGWMATFADMVTLLLCFFVLLLSFANQDVSKFRTLMGSIQDAFGVQTKRPEADQVAFSPTRFERKEVSLDQDNKVLLGMVLQLKALIEEEELLKKSVKIASDDQGVIMRVPNDLVFKPNTAELLPDAHTVLDNAVAILKEYNFNLVVRGHTDNENHGSQSFPTNWELSAARAATALRYIMDKGNIPSTRLKAVGYADSQPLVPNDTPENRAFNRRMEFFFHRPGAKSW